MKLPILVYDCDNCGLCCTKTLIFADTVDAQREPRILNQRRIKQDGRITNRYLLNRNPGDPGGEQCVFHTGEKCGIYSSRPNVCVGFQAGGSECTILRATENLPPLVPRQAEIEEDYASIFAEPKGLQTPTEGGTLAPSPQDAGNSAVNG